MYDIVNFLLVGGRSDRAYAQVHDEPAAVPAPDGGGRVAPQQGHRRQDGHQGEAGKDVQGRKRADNSDRALDAMLAACKKKDKHK